MSQSLVLFGAAEGPVPGIASGDQIYPVEAPHARFGELVRLWGSGRLRAPTGSPSIESSSVRLLPPLDPLARVFAVAQNYPAHAAEAGGTSPATPVIFWKAHSAFVGHHGDARIPSVTNFLDYEGEIAVVVGKDLSRATPLEAQSAIAGYTIANDGSARDLQDVTLGGRQIVDWFSAKCLERSSALGPGIIPARTAGSLMGMSIRTLLNGSLVQSDSAASMHVPPAGLLAFISHRVSLRPGDVILSGTPAGVGKSRSHALRDGDEVSVSVTGLGELTVTYRASDEIAQ